MFNRQGLTTAKLVAGDPDFLLLFDLAEAFPCRIGEDSSALLSALRRSSAEWLVVGPKFQPATVFGNFTAVRWLPCAQRPHFLVHITSEEVSPGAEITVERPALPPEKGPGTHPAALPPLIDPSHLPPIRTVIYGVLASPLPAGTHARIQLAWCLPGGSSGQHCPSCARMHV